VRVICATIAFGMGINKPNVRFVLHYDLPKNLEGYYQETGRAGRDSLPSECVLLFSAADVVKQTAFIDEKTDPEEQRVARAQLQQMVHFAESSGCRRTEMLGYFGETWTEENCGACDNCLTPRETFDGTLAAQKLLSCFYRVRERSGFNFGLNHVIEVLTGGQTEAIRKWGHEKISAYGIGSEMRRGEWQAIGRELIRLGLLEQSAEKFATVGLSDEGLAALKSRRPITLTKPPAIAEKKARTRKGEIACDERLFESLRRLRKEIADSRNVPAYVIFGDVTLREMARAYPTTETAFRNLTGVGDKKLEEFGAPFMDAIIKYLRENPKQRFD
jgi:ATP-dependent DNA helicase RecQ